MKRHYPSGAEKRKKREHRAKIAAQQSNSLTKFLSPPLQATDPSNEETVTDNVNVIDEASEQLETIENVDVDIESQVAVPIPTVHRNEQTIQSDIALWPENMTEEMVNYFVVSKPGNIGDINKMTMEYKDGDRIYTRRLLESHFYYLKPNGEKERREWLVFSETTESVYCYICKLFLKNKTKMATGCNDWRNVNNILKDHESSRDHISAVLILKKRLSIRRRIDTALTQQIDCQRNYWREILKRVVATVKLLATLGLPFRGHREDKFSEKKGNFASILEYLAEFDDFLRNHLERYGNAGSGFVNYLSPTTFNDFVTLMGNEVKQTIIHEIKKAVYYAIILDSTPDITNCDQLTFIIRYVDQNGDVKERFIGFLQIDSHDAAYMELTVLNTLQELGLDIKNCRGQSYDNAANMSGKYNGLQAKIKQICSLASFVPCASHSLNLVGNSAAESCSSAVHFFAFLQNLYTYFSSSPRRWNMLLGSFTNPKFKHLKKLSDTRWSARADAVSALKQNYQTIKSVLSKIYISESEQEISKLEAKKLHDIFDKFETALFTILWDNLLQRINNTNQSLQNAQNNLFQATNLLNSLVSYILHAKNNFSAIEESAKLLTDNHEYEKFRIRKIKLHFDESRDNNSNPTLIGRENCMVNIHNVICDKILVELGKRSKIYKDVLNDFQIFFNLEMNSAQFKEEVGKVGKKYENDIEKDYLEDEITHFLKYAKEEKMLCPVEMYKSILDGL